MLAWLNEHLGLDWATYLGLAAGVIALIIGGKQMSQRQTQNVSGSHNSASQAGRDINRPKDDV